MTKYYDWICTKSTYFCQIFFKNTILLWRFIRTFVVWILLRVGPSHKHIFILIIIIMFVDFNLFSSKIWGNDLKSNCFGFSFCVRPVWIQNLKFPLINKYRDKKYLNNRFMRRFKSQHRYIPVSKTNLR